jgi:hypothetical protein
MNKQSKFIAAAAAALLAAACTNTSKHQAMNVAVDIEQQSAITDLIKSEHHVILETKDSSLINRVGHLTISNDTIILNSGAEIMVFSPKGKFITGFNYQGQGPQEYLSIDALRADGGLVYILDRQGRQIMVYTSAGEFVRRLKLDCEYIDFYPVDNDKILLASGNFNESMHEFVLVSATDAAVIERFAPYGVMNTTAMWDYIPFAGATDDAVLVNVPFCTTTYSIAGKEMAAYATFSFNSQEQLPACDLKTLNIEQMTENTRNHSVVRQLGYIAETPGATYLTYSYFSLQGGFMDHLVKIDESGKQIAASAIGAEIFEEYPYLTSITSVIGDKIVDIKDASLLLDMDARAEKTFWQQQGLTEDSNPVVFYYTLK